MNRVRPIGCLLSLGAVRRDYLGIAPAWFTSCRSVYYVLICRPSGWQPGTMPFSTHGNQWAANVVPDARGGDYC